MTNQHNPEKLDNACIVCGTPDFQVRKAGDAHTFVQCSNCTLAYIHPIKHDDHPTVDGAMSTRTKHEYNESMYADYAERAHTAKQMVGPRLALYQNLMGRQPQSILEVGCGEGAWYTAFRQSGHSTSFSQHLPDEALSWRGLEINRDLAAFGQTLGNPVEVVDFLEMVEATRYDIIFASQVLEHILQPHDFVAKAAALLEPGGLLHVDVPNFNGLQSRVYQVLSTPTTYGFLEWPHHQVSYTAPALRLLLESAGLSVKVVRAATGNDAALGQLNQVKGTVANISYKVMDVLQSGSLLVGIAQNPA